MIQTGCQKSPVLFHLLLKCANSSSIRVRNWTCDQQVMGLTTNLTGPAINRSRVWLSA